MADTKKEDKKAQEAAQEPAQESVDETAELKAKLDAAEKELADLREQNIRRQAETDNYRKRLVREKEEAVQFANEKLVEDLMDFLDNLDRALAAAGTSEEVKGLVDGLNMTKDQLLGTLNRNWGLEQIKSVGEEFNPMEHEACMMTVDESLEKETVLDEFLKGYKLHGRVIRPAKVRIGKPQA